MKNICKECLKNNVESTTRIIHKYKALTTGTYTDENGNKRSRPKNIIIVCLCSNGHTFMDKEF